MTNMKWQYSAEEKYSHNIKGGWNT